MLLFNGEKLDLGKSTSQLAKKVRKDIQHLKDNVSENGKHLVILFDDKLKKPRRIGYQGKGGTKPKFHEELRFPPSKVMEKFADVSIDLKDDGNFYNYEVIYAKNIKTDGQGNVTTIKRDRWIFNGREFIDIDKNPEWAWFVYFACPHMNGGGNQGGVDGSYSTILRVQNRRKDAVDFNEKRKLRSKVEYLILSEMEEGGLPIKDVRKYARGVLFVTDEKTRSNEEVRQLVFQRVEKDEQLLKTFLTDINIEGRIDCQNVAVESIQWNIVKLFNVRGKKQWRFVGEDGGNGDLIIEIPVTSDAKHILGEIIFKDTKLKEKIESMISDAKAVEADGEQDE